MQSLHGKGDVSVARPHNYDVIEENSLPFGRWNDEISSERYEN